MSRITNPDRYPWDAPNYTFSIPGWPPGFVPQGDAASLARVGQGKAAAARARDLALQTGDTGSFRGGLSKKSSHVVGDARKAMVKRGRG